MAIIIKTNGKTEEVTDLSLENMQKIVGGYIQIITTANGRYSLIMDEEGKLKGKKMNLTATNYAFLNGCLLSNDYIVGDVILAEKSEII